MSFLPLFHHPSQETLSPPRYRGRLRPGAVAICACLHAGPVIVSEHERLVRRCHQAFRTCLPVSLGSQHETVPHCFPASDEVWGLVPTVSAQLQALKSLAELGDDSSAIGLPIVHGVVTWPPLWDRGRRSWHLCSLLFCYVNNKLNLTGLWPNLPAPLDTRQLSVDTLYLSLSFPQFFSNML